MQGWGGLAPDRATIRWKTCQLVENCPFPDHHYCHCDDDGNDCHGCDVDCEYCDDDGEYHDEDDINNDNRNDNEKERNDDYIAYAYLDQ